MWRVNIASTAQKALRRFPTSDAHRITAALGQMAVDPFSGDIRKLGDNNYRQRVGPYRIFFEVFPPLRFVQVTAIVRRTSTTY